MRITTIPTLLVLTLVLAACNGGGEAVPAAQPAAQPAAAAAVQVRAELFTDEAGLLRVAWVFDLAERWHLYADLLNDSGYPPSVTWELPDRWRAGPLRWPVPERYVLPGGILDHVYHGRLVLEQELFPVGGRPAEPTELAATVSWLACREECVPGKARITVSAPGGDAPLPRPATIPAVTWPAALPAGLATAAPDTGALVITVPGARALRFFPSAGSGPFRDLVADGEARGDRLNLRLKPSPGSRFELRGLLQVEGQDGSVLTGPFDCLDPDNHGG